MSGTNCVSSIANSTMSTRQSPKPAANRNHCGWSLRLHVVKPPKQEQNFPVEERRIPAHPLWRQSPRPCT
ncbi:hypothetical protein [Streptomyces virginiae]|uniref:hypothetical protein n=1 Tax=Streptomyces virginiae TaxID=1961 RepID=UPI00365F9E56